uniref:Legume lectin domain-containing protein n=1 Tax=Nelumbo nucifera TaxID=4432 RepID=A0A822YHH0_NELNU|nr:TPA_asm: hypothetical protein HUJ06_009590 [Nelumbo nucifera]
MAAHLLHLLLLLLLAKTLLLQLAFVADFVFNSFISFDLLFYGTATHESRLLVLTNTTAFTIGQALYNSKKPTRAPNTSAILPFYTSIFSITPNNGQLSGHGIVFIFAPTSGINGTTSSRYLGFVNHTNNDNRNNHLFGIEFVVLKNQAFNDINDNHIGVDKNLFTSMTAEPACY